MQQLKDAIISSPALIPIDYISSRPVFLSIDSSWRAVGWILSQECEDGQRRPSRFGSISWNDRETRYSQPKIELYGLFRTLRALRIHIVGVTNLIVEMDAKFVKGMLSNPDTQPNAAMNRWIAAILLFSFKLVHVPAEKHTGPDGLSRREPIPGEDEDEGDPEEWIDDFLSLGIWIDTWQNSQVSKSSALKVPPGGVGPAPTATPTRSLPNITPLHAYLPPSTPSTTTSVFATTRSATARATAIPTTPTANTTSTDPSHSPPNNSKAAPIDSALPTHTTAAPPLDSESASRPHNLLTRYDEIERIHGFLGDPARISDMQPSERSKFIRRARHFFICDSRLWRRQAQGRHQLVLNPV